MPEHRADRNLLFGILAMQNNFIDRDALLAAFNAWVVDKSRDLGLILVAKGLLTEGRRALLDALVGEHLRQHGDDPRLSLAALSSAGPAREALGAIPDRDLHASLGHVPGTRVGDDADMTRLGTAVGPASSVGRFRIIRPHDKGGLGLVFVALDLELGRQVALKEIQGHFADDPESRSRFVQEAEITGKLEHPGIVPVYGLGHDPDGRPYYAMRFIKGDSLLAAIKRFHAADGGGDAGHRAVELRDLVGRFLDVCDAIAYAHSRGVLHRDLKPGNVMLGPFGETLVVDWGLAKPLGCAADPSEEPVRPSSGDGSSHDTHGAVGTPAYMSPEQAECRYDLLGPASDVYSLGATLYHVLTGRAPFAADDGPILPRVIRGEFPAPRLVRREVPRPLEAVCLKAMARAPAGRYDSPRALADDVRRWLAGEPVRAWREPWTTRVGRRIARHRTAVASASAATLVGLFAAAVAWNQSQVRSARESERARSLVKSLATAETEHVPKIIEELRAYRGRVARPLRDVYGAGSSSSRARLHAGLALLQDDPGIVEYLYEQLLTADPSVLIVIRDALKPAHARRLGPRLWEVLGDARADWGRRLRAACALADYEPADPRWPGFAGPIVASLVTENRLLVGGWARALRPIKAPLRDELATIVRLRDHDAKRPPAEVAQATDILLDYLPDEPESLAGLILDLDARSFNGLIGRLDAGRDRALVALRRSMGDATPSDPIGRDLHARRLARATIALARLRDADPLLRLLTSAPDPASRAYLLAEIGTLGVDRHLVSGRLEKESDAAALRALVLGLGEFTDWTADERRALVARLTSLYREARDPGLHSAAEWALRTLAGDVAIRAIDPELAGREPPQGRGWYVNREGQTLAVFGPQLFEMGSPVGEPDRNPLGDETRHRRRIARRFAVATKEVTQEQFRRFRPDSPQYEGYGPEDDGPVLAVSWTDAALYCRWLSAREGIDEDQMYYLPAPGSEDGVIVPPNALERNGYRLPTEAEWECACRAGTTTARPCGDTAVLLSRYAWFGPHAAGKAHTVGRLRPNDWGLFDMLGNADEWCHDPYADYPAPAGGLAAEDAPRTDLSKSHERIQRGCGFRYAASDLRSAQREWYDHRDRNTAFGFRVARTMPGNGSRR